MIDANQLSRTQRRVMQYLVHGHTAYRQYGSVVCVNGGKICTEATMRALERRQLVIHDGQDGWNVNPQVITTSKGEPQ